MKSYVYEVYTVENNEEIIVDILRFYSEGAAREFESGLVGEYKVRPLTLSAEKLVDLVLDIRDDLLEDKFRLEDNVEELEGALHVARSYIEEIIPSMKSSTALKTKSGTKSKIHRFPLQKH